MDPSTRTQPTRASERSVSSGLVLRCWGTRGSIPTPGSDTVRYGGNTTCFEVRHGRQRLIFDAGSGIRPLGLDVVEKGPDTIHIFLTHFHWDHIQGFPFFAPLYDPEDSIKIVGPKQKDIDVQNLFAGQMGPIYFPVPFSVVAAAMEFEHLNDGAYDIGGVHLEVMRVKHPSFVLAYRIEADGRSICLIPDNEMQGDMYEVGPEWERKIVDFVGDADLLVHDSMYTEEEYERRKGWGHSTFSQSIRLAEEGGVGKLLFFHHDPTRTDDQLDGIVARLRDDVLARGSSLEIEAASEGVDLSLDSRPVAGDQE